MVVRIGWNSALAALLTAASAQIAAMNHSSAANVRGTCRRQSRPGGRAGRPGRRAGVGGVTRGVVVGVTWPPSRSRPDPLQVGAGVRHGTGRRDRVMVSIRRDDAPCRVFSAGHRG
ncbi:hypothetical protein TPA0907_03280 [Micromonospora humidisoli]|nr:hypothetical protein TPA0907_03280 [Micromonospora sp. AKA109]